MPSPTPTGAASRQDFRILGGVFALMVLGLVGLAAATGWQETRAALVRLSLLQATLLLGLSLVNYGLRGLRWHLFANRLGLGLGLGRNVLHFLAGFAMSATPGRVGELVRMRWIRRETGWSFERTAPLVLIDRASDLLAMGLLLGLALGLSTGGMTGAVPVALLALTAAWIATHPQLLHRLAGWAYGATGRFPRLFARLRRASRSLAAFRKPGTLVAAALLGAAGWFAECYAFHLLLAWMGTDVAFWRAVAIFLFATLAGGLTGAPGGVGGAEAAMIALLSLEGVPLAVSIPATAIIRVTTLWFAIGIGLTLFPLAERHPKGTRHADAPA